MESLDKPEGHLVLRFAAACNCIPVSIDRLCELFIIVNVR